MRKVDPNYKPNLDPGPANPPPAVIKCPLGFTSDHWPHILVVSAGLILMHRLPRKAG